LGEKVGSVYFGHGQNPGLERGLLRNWICGGEGFLGFNRRDDPKPQGLTPLDRELERRGRRFARYADDFLVLVPDRREAERAMGEVVAFVEGELKLTVNPAKSRVDRLARGVFLGCRIERKQIRRSEASPARNCIASRRPHPAETDPPERGRSGGVSRRGAPVDESYVGCVDGT